MIPVHDEKGVTIYHGDCVDVMRSMPDNSVDSIVTDPPYGISFMGKKWDYDVPSVEVWAEALRVLKPGGHMLAFGGSRTYHRVVVNIEDAGFEIRDQIMWLYGSGFPKSLDISKAIDKTSKKLNLFQPFADYLKKKISESELSKKEISEHFPSKTGGLTGCVWNWENAENIPTKEQFEILKNLLCLSDEFIELIDRVEAEREVIGKKESGIANKEEGQRHTIGASKSVEVDITAPATDAAQQWDGWGTALKPAHEPICVARKPLTGTVAENVLEHGTGGINIDGCRVKYEDTLDPATNPLYRKEAGYKNKNSPDNGSSSFQIKDGSGERNPHNKGRFPANLILDPEAGAMLDKRSGTLTSGDNCTRQQEGFFMEHGGLGKEGDIQTTYGDTGGASRFFYCAKASKADRDEGLEGMPLGPPPASARSKPAEGRENALGNPRANHHPTVKPTDLMQYLCRLVTPPGGTVLDPFMGSGSTGKAAVREGFKFIGIERDKEYIPIAIARINAPAQVELI